MQLIGQNKLVDWLFDLTPENCPHFIILKGGRGCGKSTLTNILAKKLNAEVIEFSPTAEKVRSIISTVYSIKEPTVYVCEDLDTMKPQASNALLKVTEETPKYAYIVLHTIGTPLATLKSRAQVFEFEPYSFENFKQYADTKEFEMPDHADVLIKSCTSLTDFEYYTVSAKFEQTYELCCKVLDYISEVSTVNAFKILKDMALKKDAEGIDPAFFLTVLLNEYVAREGKVQYGNIIVEESIKALQKLNNAFLSKQSIMDVWVLNIMRGIDNYAN